MMRWIVVLLVHIHLMSGTFLNYYRDKISLDGGFVKNPYLKVINSSLHITLQCGKQMIHIGLNFKIIDMIKKNEYKILIEQLKKFLNVTEVNPIELYLSY